MVFYAAVAGGTGPASSSTASPARHSDHFRILSLTESIGDVAKKAYDDQGGGRGGSTTSVCSSNSRYSYSARWCSERSRSSDCFTLVLEAENDDVIMDGEARLMEAIEARAPSESADEVLFPIMTAALVHELKPALLKLGRAFSESDLNERGMGMIRSVVRKRRTRPGREISKNAATQMNEILGGVANLAGGPVHTRSFLAPAPVIFNTGIGSPLELGAGFFVAPARDAMSTRMGGSNSLDKQKRKGEGEKKVFEQVEFYETGSRLESTTGGGGRIFSARCSS